ncbi:MAG: dihydrolipoyl dehydrogenase [Parachlamydiaceae bacterium]|nr:dihydrolipoyl dehydrogenase [Parachlamydiaceae bacterium]
MDEKYDVAVIGSGPGGYVAALRAAQLGFKTICIEKGPTFGGTCLNVGCIPSKALLQSSEYYSLFKEDGQMFGIMANDLSFDFAKMQQRKNKIVEELVAGISGLFKSNKVASKHGLAKFISPTRIAIDRDGTIEELEAKNFILATGSEPTQLPFLPFDEKIIVSSTGALALPAPPKKMILIGAGVIGVELASVYNRLGTEVTIIEMLDRICPTMDHAVSNLLWQLLKKQGLNFHLNAKLLEGTADNKGATLKVEIDGAQQSMDADVVLIAVGRRPFTKGLGLQEIGVEMSPRGEVTVDSSFRTNSPNIFAIGDIIDGPMLAHRASIEGIAVAEIIAGQQPRVNYMAIPNVIYTHPEVGAVGLTEKEALERNLKITIGTAQFRANARARCMGYSEGMVKVIAETQSRRIIGFHIVGHQASEMIAGCSLAIDKKTTLDEFASLSHAHPTLSETIHEAVSNAAHAVPK